MFDLILSSILNQNNILFALFIYSFEKKDTNCGLGHGASRRDVDTSHRAVWRRELSFFVFIYFLIIILVVFFLNEFFVHVLFLFIKIVIRVHELDVASAESAQRCVADILAEQLINVFNFELN